MLALVTPADGAGAGTIRARQGAADVNSSAVPGRSFFPVFVAPFCLHFRKASWQNVYLAFLF
jgi:hypothetical protein